MFFLVKEDCGELIPHFVKSNLSVIFVRSKPLTIDI